MHGNINRLITGARTVRSLKRAYDDNFHTVPMPAVLHLETTYRCTCKCAFCSRWIEGPKRTKEELTCGEMVRLIDESYDLGVRSVTLSGGEPLLKKGILDVMRHAREKGMHTGVTHNGTLINDSNVQDILSSFDTITVSLDSLDGRKHDEIRGVEGTFNKAMETLRLLKQNTRNTEITVQSVLTSENLQDMREINQRFSRLGIHTMFQPIHDNGNSLKVIKDKFKDFDRTKLAEEYSEMMEEHAYPSFISKLSLKVFYGRMIDFIEDPRSTRDCFNCFAGSFSFFVNPYGEVYPCDPLRVSMGNIRERPLKEIWCDPKSSELRKTIKNRTCNCWLLCGAPAFITLTWLFKCPVVTALTWPIR